MSIEVNNESDYAADEAEFSALARYVLDELHVHPQAELAIVFVDTQTMTDLNGRWMEEDGPTDVLSFPMDELRPGRNSSIGKDSTSVGPSSSIHRPLRSVMVWVSTKTIANSACGWTCNSSNT